MCIGTRPETPSTMRTTLDGASADGHEVDDAHDAVVGVEGRSRARACRRGSGARRRGSRRRAPPASGRDRVSPSSAANTAPESKRGTHIQSMEPSLPDEGRGVRVADEARSPRSVRVAPPPRGDEGSRVGYDTHMNSRIHDATGPLAGVTVVDLTRVLAGPFATMVLHDLGARVIKVERAGLGDDAAALRAVRRRPLRVLHVVELREGEHRARPRRRPPTATCSSACSRAPTCWSRTSGRARWTSLGFGWDALHARYPRLIYAAVSGFGRTGPYATRPAYDMVVQGMGGVMSVTGEDGGAPTRVGASIGDITAGLFLATGINAALYHRALTGEGMLVDVGMLDCQVAILENAIARYTALGEVPGPIGARHPSITPFAALRTADGEVIVAAGNDKLFAAVV